MQDFWCRDIPSAGGIRSASLEMDFDSKLEPECMAQNELSQAD